MQVDVDMSCASRKHWIRGHVNYHKAQVEMNVVKCQALVEDNKNTKH